jgi:hypothetical protein
MYALYHGAAAVHSYHVINVVEPVGEHRRCKEVNGQLLGEEMTRERLSSNEIELRIFY